jgi:hypothetical protein
MREAAAAREEFEHLNSHYELLCRAALASAEARTTRDYLVRGVYVNASENVNVNVYVYVYVCAHAHVHVYVFVHVHVLGTYLCRCMCKYMCACLFACLAS